MSRMNIVICMLIALPEGKRWLLPWDGENYRVKLPTRESEEFGVEVEEAHAVVSGAFAWVGRPLVEYVSRSSACRTTARI